MNGIDYLVFTAGIGENIKKTRESICNNMHALGIKLDSSLNEKFNHQEGEISCADSKVKVMIVSTDEGMMKIQDTIRISV